MRQRKAHDPRLQASVAINLIILYAFTLSAVAAITKHYANSPVSTPSHLTGGQSVSSGKVARTAEASGGTHQEVGTIELRATSSDGTAEQVEAQIRAIAKEAGFKWPDYLVKLAKCESRLDPKAVNTENNVPSHSKDRGLFQISDHWHPEVSDKVAFDVRLATEWTMWRINSGYQHEWVCDNYI